MTEPLTARDAVEQLAEEFLDRCRHGDAPSVSDYAAKYPELAEEIRDLFPAILVAERMAGPADAVPLPDRLGDFRIVSELGRGGMGVVYEAVQEPLGRRVALKVLPIHGPGNNTYLERFQREARAAARLQHPHIVPVFGVGEHQGSHFYAMQFIAGRGLDAVLRDVQRRRGQALTHAAPAATSVSSYSAAKPTLDATTATSPLASSAGDAYYRHVARIGADVADALTYAHSQGILHRDIKPSNLLLDGDNHVWVADFGLAKSSDDDNLTHTGELVGTLRYMAPERFCGISEPRSDVYSLGATLYELLVFRPAFFESDRARLIDQMLRKDPPAPHKLDRRIPRDLDTIIRKAMAKEPRDRYASADDLAADLRSFLADRPIAARPAALTERTWRWCRRNPLAASLCGLAASLMSVILIGSPIMLVRLWHERQEAVEQLYTAQVARAESQRLSNRAGRRFQGLESIDAALALVPDLKPAANRTLELRNQIMACAALADLGIAYEWEGYPDGSEGVAVDAQLTRYARSDASGNITVRRICDDVEVQKLPGAGQGAWTIKFSPEGCFLAAGYQLKSEAATNRICIWNLETGAKVHEVASSANCGESAFGPGPRVAFGRNNSTLVVYDLNQPNAPPTEFTSRTPTNAVAFHPRGDQVAIAQLQQVEVREIKTGAVVSTWNHTHYIASLAWRPDGSMLAVAVGNSIVLWETGSTAPTATLTGHESMVTEVAFGRGGGLLASKAHDGTVRLWDVEARRELIRASNVFTGCAQLQFAPDDAMLGFTSDGAKLRLWKVASGAECRVVRVRHTLGWDSFAGCFSPDGRLLAACGSDGVHIVDVTTGRPAAFLPLLQTWSAHWSADGKSLITSGFTGLHHWPISADMATGNMKLGPPVRLAFDEPLKFADASPDGRIVTANTKSGSVIIAEAGGAKLRATIPHYPQLFYHAISPDGRRVATATVNHRGVKVWNALDATFERDLAVDSSASTTFSPDGCWLVVATGTELQFWDTATWTKAHVVRKQPETPVARVSFASDGALVAVRHAPSVLRLIEVATGNLLAELETPNQQSMTWHALSPDGCKLAAAVGGSTIHVWDLHALRELLATRGLDWQPRRTPAAAGPPPTIRLELDAATLHARADDFCRRREYDRAQADLYEALQQDPHRAATQHALATLMVYGPSRLRDKKWALSLARDAANGEQTRNEYRWVLAAALYRNEQFQEAVDILEPDQVKADGPALFVLAMAQHRLGKATEGRDTYTRALKWWRSLNNVVAPRLDYLSMLRDEAESLLLTSSPR